MKKYLLLLIPGMLLPIYGINCSRTFLSVNNSANNSDAQNIDTANTNTMLTGNQYIPNASFVPQATPLPSPQTDTYVYTHKFTSTGQFSIYQCELGYSIASATVTMTSGQGVCIPEISANKVFYGGCLGDYYLQAVCIKTPTQTFTELSLNSQTANLTGKILSATDVESPSGDLSCIPNIFDNKVTHGGCGIRTGQQGYYLTSVYGNVADTKVFTDSYDGFDGRNVHIMTCPLGYSAVSATEITVSGDYQCIPHISADKVTYGGCESIPGHGKYFLTAVCAKISAANLSTLSPTSTIYTLPNFCRHPKHYHYDLPPSGTGLTCDSNGNNIIFNTAIPDSGKALAVANLNFSNNPQVMNPQATYGSIYYWNGSLVVGDGKIAYGVGDDVHPNTTTSVKTILGFGNLSAASNFLTFRSFQGVGGTCITGELKVTGSIDIWIEDPSPHCVGKDVGLISSYDIYGFGDQGLYTWTTQMTEILSIAVPVDTNNQRSGIHVFHSVEGTPRDSQQSGQPMSAYLISQAKANNLGLLSQVQDYTPRSMSMGHVVLGSGVLANYSKSMDRLSLWVGTNTDLPIYTTTNGCCGDAKIGFVKSP